MRPVRLFYNEYPAKSNIPSFIKLYTQAPCNDRSFIEYDTSVIQNLQNDLNLKRSSIDSISYHFNEDQGMIVELDGTKFQIESDSVCKYAFSDEEVKDEKILNTLLSIKRWNDTRLKTYALSSLLNKTFEIYNFERNSDGFLKEKAVVGKESNKSQKWDFLTFYFADIHDNGDAPKTNSTLANISKELTEKKSDLINKIHSNEEGYKIDISQDDLKKKQFSLHFAVVESHQITVICFEDKAMIVDNGSLNYEEEKKIRKELADKGFKEENIYRRNINPIDATNNKRGDCVASALGWILKLEKKIQDGKIKNFDELTQYLTKYTANPLLPPFLQSDPGNLASHKWIIRHAFEKFIEENPKDFKEQIFKNDTFYLNCGLFAVEFDTKLLKEAIQNETAPKFMIEALAEKMITLNIGGKEMKFPETRMDNALNIKELNEKQFDVIQLYDDNNSSCVFKQKNEQKHTDALDQKNGERVR